MKLSNTHNKDTMPSAARQSGFTLIELLIAMTLGIFIIGGVITSFVSTKDSDRMRSAASAMDADARMALQMLRETISHAGYPSIGNHLIDKAFYSEMDGEQSNTACSNSINLNAPSNDNGDSYTPGEDQYSTDRTTTGYSVKGDILTVVYLADNPCTSGNASCTGTTNINPKALTYSDCTGGGATRDTRAVACSTENMPDPRDAKIYSTFYLKKVSNEYQLYCRGSRGGAQPVIENVKNMQFLYGVKQDNGAVRYFDANAVETNDHWGNVVSVRVGLLMQSAEKNLVDATSQKTHYILLNEKIEVTNLTRLYRVYTTTINLPNKNTGALL